MTRIEISSNAEAVIRRLGGFPPEMLQEVAHAMDLQNELTVGYIQAKKLSERSSTTLGVVTNRLRGSVRPSVAVVQGNAVESTIGTNVAYAGAHEFGFDGIVQVKGFTRHNPRGDRNSSNGGVVSLASGRIRKVKIKQTASGITVVKPFSRHMKMPERSFLRTGVAERAPNYSLAISNAIITAWQNGDQS